MHPGEILSCWLLSIGIPWCALIGKQVISSGISAIMSAYNRNSSIEATTLTGHHADPISIAFANNGGSKQNTIFSSYFFHWFMITALW
jgi:hypothetical protein